MSAELLALFLFVLLARGLADKNWLNTPGKIWSIYPDANSTSYENTIEKVYNLLFEIFDITGYNKSHKP